MAHHTANTDYRFWRLWTLLLTALSSILVMVIAVLLLMTDDNVLTRKNLFYTMWKNGLWRYDENFVLDGLLRDKSYRNSLIGMTVADFSGRFPYTFFEVKDFAGTLPENQKRMVANFVKSLHPEEGIDGWIATFENGKLIDFYYGRGK